MWAVSKFEDLVQYNEGFKTNLISTPAQIADPILLRRSLGVDILLAAVLHCDDEIALFGEQALPFSAEAQEGG